MRTRMHVLLYSVIIRRHALMLLYLPKFKAELINANIPNSKTADVFLLVGPATDRRAHVLYMYRLDFDLCTMCVCMHCAMLRGIKRGQS